LRKNAEHPVLAGPLRRQFGEASNAQAVGEPETARNAEPVDPAIRTTHSMTVHDDDGLELFSFPMSDSSLRNFNSRAGW
jgi:hypothetical protein